MSLIDKIALSNINENNINICVSEYSYRANMTRIPTTKQPSEIQSYDSLLNKIVSFNIDENKVTQRLEKYHILAEFCYLRTKTTKKITPEEVTMLGQ